MAEEEITLNLRILSPSTEVEGGVVFQDISGSTTVRDLRARIRDAFPSKPSPERMRLIYRGRVVAIEDATLVNVFGADNIRESKDQSLHLVLRELAPAVNGSSLPASQSPAVPTQNEALPRLPPNPFRAIPQPQRPNSQPELPPHHHHTPQQPHVHHRHHHMPGPTGPFPIPTFGQHVRQTMAQNPPPFGNIPPQNGQNQQTPGGSPEPPINGTAPPPPFGQTLIFGQGLPRPGMIPSGGRTVRQEGIGPNGERWSVTINETNVDVSGHPLHPLQPHNPPQTGDVTFLSRASLNLANARQEIHVALGLNEASFNEPLGSTEQINRRLANANSYLDLVERDTATLIGGSDVALRGQASTLRDAARVLRARVDTLSNSLSETRRVTAQSNPPTQSSPSGVPSELYVLSSPQGPVAVLYDQRGTFRTAPMVQTLPYQTYSNLFAQNRQQIAGLGQQIALGRQLVNARLPNLQPTPTQPPTAGARAAPNQPQDQAQPPAQNQDQRPAQVQVIAPPEEDRVGNIAGHLWLIFKLACFVYFFAGGGSGWYRPIVLCLMAGLVYLAQVGVFDTHFNVIRQHFEALLPVGALADRVAQPANAQAQQQRHAGMAGLTPEEAARRLMAERQGGAGWLRESVRAVERSLAIFLASLWPGIGERMVHAQEERIRVERAAEEAERQRVEDERKKAEEEAQQHHEQSEKQDSVSANAQMGEGGGSSGKGKERADEDVQDEQA